MKKTILLVLAMVGAMSLNAKTMPEQYPYDTVAGDALKARLYTLPNGLRVYLSKNTEKPEIQTYVAISAGSKDDPQESTGLAHYLEHIMFKGTEQYGTTNYALEKPNLNAIDSLYEVYGKTRDAETRAAIYHQIDSISYESSKIAIANEFDKLMDGIGASRVNAYTSTERTCYHEVIPAGEIERWAMIESDRFQHLVIRGFHTELEAVYEEYNMSLTNDTRKVLQAMNNLLYAELPYRQHSTIGTQEHLKNPSLINVRNFYNTYYRPNNAAICLSGDLDFDKTIAIIDKYFGNWEPNKNLHKPQYAPLKPLETHKDSIVMGVESPSIWMAWRFPGSADPESEIIELLSEVLMNGKCGLFDLNLLQRQRVLEADAFPYEGQDYTTFFLIGAPKEGQSLEEVRDLMLAEIEKLKKGDFSEQILKGIITNMRRHEMQRLQSNEARAEMFVESFINNTPWEEEVGKLARMSKLTKADIVRVANKYFTEGYGCIYKQQGEDATITKVEKPQISPIEMNRESVSDFRMQLMQMQSERLRPQFLDIKKDITIDTIGGKLELLYTKNTENELFFLEYVFDCGSKADPVLDLAEAYMPYLGTKNLSAEALQTQLYMLGCDFTMSVSEGKTYIVINGLNENMEATMRLMEDWFAGAKENKYIYQALVEDRIRNHEDSKANQRACFAQLQTYGMRGAEAVRELTPAEMQKLSPKDVLKHARAITAYNQRAIYYGPASKEEVEKLILKTHKVSKKMLPAEQPDHYQNIPVTSKEIIIAPYDAKNIYFMAYANWGEVYTPKDEALIMLFNEYFDGSMGSIVFQEMRESRALAYTAGARYMTASYAGENNGFMQYIISQNDKLQNCIEAFDSICNFMPVSVPAFEQAKQSLLMQIEQRRYVRHAPINAVLTWRQRGWDHDWYEDIYHEAQRLTIEDIIAFQKSHVANRQYRYMILGDEKQLDMDYLQKLGTIKRVSIEDIFGY